MSKGDIKILPDQSVLRELLDYDPETGALTWKARGAKWFTDGQMPAEALARRWSTSYAGTPALSCIHSTGYRVGNLCGQYLRSHRVIWKWMTGEEPEAIDHLNHNRADNRWVNLRSVPTHENTKNKRLLSENATGVNGVSYSKSKRCYVAYITVKRKRIPLGCFSTIEKAAAARAEANLKYGFHPNHGASK